MTNLLEFRNVSKVYTRGLISKSSTTALENVSLKLTEEPSTIMAIAGESGSGKTTLAMLLLGFITPTTGQILYKGEDIRHLRGAERLNYRREVQAVFQDPFAVFNPFYTVDHLLEVPIKQFKLTDNPKSARRMMEDALTAVGLHPQDVLGRFPHQLSGGQRQRINVARALILRPKVLVADEPVSMVDASLRANILETLQTLQRDYGVNIIYITHDLTTAFHIAKSIVVLYRGNVMEAGDVDKTIMSPEHPYTKLLIDSIPWPDITRKWGEEKIMVRDDIAVHDGTSCKFLARCPFAMEKCHIAPPLYRLNSYQGAACYLHDNNPQVALDDLSELLPV